MRIFQYQRDCFQMKEIPPKLLHITKEEGELLKKRARDGTISAKELDDVKKLAESFCEIIDFIKNADEKWDNHKFETDYGWRKKQLPKE